MFKAKTVIKVKKKTVRLIVQLLIKILILITILLQAGFYSLSNQPWKLFEQQFLINYQMTHKYYGVNSTCI